MIDTSEIAPVHAGRLDSLMMALALAVAAMCGGALGLIGHAPAIAAETSGG